MDFKVTNKSEVPTEEKIPRTVYGGYVGKLPSVESNNGAKLICFTCGEIGLEHDAHAYWHEVADDLLCESCYDKKIDKAGYELVLTQHA